MFTLAFWKAAAERAAKTFAQTLLAVVGVGYGFSDIDWSKSLSVAGVATLVSVLTSVASDAATSGSGPSLTDAEVLSPPAVDPTEDGPKFPGYASGV